MAKESKEKSGIEHEAIRALAELLDETGLSEIEIEKSGLRIRVARNLTVSANTIPLQPPPGPARNHGAPANDGGTLDLTSHPGAVKSPMVGTAYRAPEPGAPPFAEVGSRVTEGQTILIIEAMKTMNHIPAPRAGTITQMLVENGQPVEFGEPLAIIE